MPLRGLWRLPTWSTLYRSSAAAKKAGAPSFRWHTTGRRAAPPRPAPTLEELLGTVQKPEKQPARSLRGRAVPHSAGEPHGRIPSVAPPDKGSSPPTFADLFANELFGKGAQPARGETGKSVELKERRPRLEAESGDPNNGADAPSIAAERASLTEWLRAQGMEDEIPTPATTMTPPASSPPSAERAGSSPPASGQQQQQQQQILDDQQTILVLSATSKSLLPSDFYRVGASASAHVEGWHSGIQQAIQMRDPATLAPLARYALVFATPHAAARYYDECVRLHRLVSSGGPSSGSGRDDDTRSSVAAFTLAAPSGTPLRLAAVATPAQGGVPGEAFWQTRWGGLADRVGRNGGREGLGGFRDVVLVSVAGGGTAATAASLDRASLVEALARDGRRRNLPWGVRKIRGVVSLPDLVGGDSSGAASCFRLEGGVLEREEVAVRGGGGTNGPASPDDGNKAGLQAKRSRRKRYRRFVLAFDSAIEARRFVRHWHRRDVDHLMSDRDSHAERSVLNVEVLW